MTQAAAPQPTGPACTGEAQRGQSQAPFRPPPFGWRAKGLREPRQPVTPSINHLDNLTFFDKFRIPAALLSGTLFASGFLQISEIASYQLPPYIIDYCLLILGSSVGCRFADKTFGEIARNALHSFVATFLLVALGLLAAFAASLIIDKNFFTLLLSYCPGGIYEVAVIAIFFDLDPEFVSFHHIIRLLMILFIVPLILRIIEKKT